MRIIQVQRTATDVILIPLPHPNPPPPPLSNYTLNTSQKFIVLTLSLTSVVHVHFSLLQLTPDNSNLQGKLKKVRVIGSSSYRG